MDDSSVNLMVTVPICSFRKGVAREFLETEIVPPPSTVYGFLLSLVGEEDRSKYVGTRIAYACVSAPQLSLVLRTVWRVKDKDLPPGVGNNRRPDYQEILTGLSLAIWVDKGDLARTVKLVRERPDKIERYGGLSFGESRDLVNDLIWFPRWNGGEGKWVTADPKGDLSLPLWVDHVGSRGTVREQFRLESGKLESPSRADSRWIAIVSSK